MERIFAIQAVALTGKMKMVEGVVMTPKVAKILLTDVPLIKVVGADLRTLCKEVNC